MGNSGLAIFSRSVMRDIAKMYDDEYFDHVVDHDCIDCWISMELQIGKVRGKVAPASLARLFSVETIYDGTYTPFGTHKAMANLLMKPDKSLWKILAGRCPEARQISCDTLGTYPGAGWRCSENER